MGLQGIFAFTSTNGPPQSLVIHEFDTTTFTNTGSCLHISSDAILPRALSIRQLYVQLSPSTS